MRLFLSVDESIKINQLIRGGISLEGFNAWYDALSAQERKSLTTTLFFCAYQAGVDEETWQQAATSGVFAHHTKLIDQIKSFHLTDIGLHDLPGFASWFDTLSSSDQHTTFVIGVFLFGVAEGTVFRNETVASCNHWWHRDLLDARVVEAILNDPEYYRTSMKHDARIKSCAA